MLIVITKDYKDMSKKAAEIIISDIKEKPKLILGLPTGETPLGMYKLLVNAFRNKKINFSKIRTFNLDEYFPISKGDKNSYHYFMNKNFFNHINIKKININFLDGETKKPIKSSLLYERKIKENPIDIQILGLGINGHIGFNEPGSSFDSRTRLISLSKATIKRNSKYFKNKNDVPKKAMTMGIETIMRARKIILLADGKDKASAISHLVEGRISKKWPVTALRKHKNLIVIIDKDAARKIK